MTWAAVLVGAAGCYLLKLAGLSVPQRLLAGERTRRFAGLLPVALLGALVVTQTVGDGQQLRVDARLLGVAAAVVAVTLRAPFLVVVGLAAATTAIARLVA
jgi:branched-subunit amino acid transport protein